MGDFKYGTKAYQAQQDGYFQLINQKIEGNSKVEARILGLDVLPRLLVCLDNHTQSCSVCRNHHQSLLLMIDKLPSVIAGHDASLRKELEKHGKDVFLHLEKEHLMMPRGKAFAYNSLLFMLAGMATGGLIGYIGVLPSVGGALVLGWLLGTLVGGIIGKVKEEKLRKANKLF